MTVNVRIAIASHLSNAQEYLEFGFRKNASSEINLAKAILFKYVSTDLEVEERELNELAHEVFNRLSKKVTATILSMSLLTVMAGAAIAPALGIIKAHFSGAPAMLVQFIVSMPGFKRVPSKTYSVMLTDFRGQ